MAGGGPSMTGGGPDIRVAATIGCGSTPRSASRFGVGATAVADATAVSDSALFAGFVTGGSVFAIGPRAPRLIHDAKETIARTAPATIHRRVRFFIADCGVGRPEGHRPVHQ